MSASPSVVYLGRPRHSRSDRDRRAGRSGLVHRARHLPVPPVPASADIRGRSRQDDQPGFWALVLWHSAASGSRQRVSPSIDLNVLLVERTRHHGDQPAAATNSSFGAVSVEATWVHWSGVVFGHGAEVFSNPAPATQRRGPLTWAYARRRPFRFPAEIGRLRAYQAAEPARTLDVACGTGFLWL